MGESVSGAAEAEGGDPMMINGATDASHTH